MKPSRRREEVLKRAALAAALYAEREHTLQSIAERLGYRSEGAIRHLLSVHALELERSDQYRRNFAETSQKV
jgi:hypothetical protein